MKLQIVIPAQEEKTIEIEIEDSARANGISTRVNAAVTEAVKPVVTQTVTFNVGSFERKSRSKSIALDTPESGRKGKK